MRLSLFLCFPWSSPPTNSIFTVSVEIALGIPTGGKKADANKPESYPHIPLNRPGTAEEAAQAVLFLCSPLAAYVSGHTLE